MKTRKYYLAFEGEKLAANFEAYEENTKIEQLIGVCELSGWTVKEVSKSEYENEKKIAKEKDLKEFLSW